jgi:hypothetical protein
MSEGHYTTKNGKRQGDETETNHIKLAEALFNLFKGNTRRYVKNEGPPIKEISAKGEDKWKLKVITCDEVVTLDLWKQHLSGEFILSIIPRLDNGMCWFACIDYDRYQIDYQQICQHIRDFNLPLLPLVSKSSGLHLFIFFREPVSADQAIRALHYMAGKLGFAKGEYEIFPTSANGSEFCRAVAMPYGAQWDVLPEQCYLTGHGNQQLLGTFIAAAERDAITAKQLPRGTQEQEGKANGQDKERKVPLALQAAINSVGPYDRSALAASIIYWMTEAGFGAEQIKTHCENRGPFLHYTEKNTSLDKDIKRVRAEFFKRHPDKAKDQEPALEVQSTAEFVNNFVPPDYLVDGLLQRRFIYSMTGTTGDGKTAVALLIALCVSQGWSVDGREIDKGKVLYCAGENPDDVRMRWIKQLADANLDPDTIDVHFIPGSFAISSEVMRERILQANTEKGPFDLLVFDTSAAFFAGDDDNVNMQMLAHAKSFRSFVPLIGNPTVIVPSHPVKNFSRDNMIPRGGGAFLNEMDGNLTCMKVDGTMLTELHWCGKIRGIDFNAIPFQLEVGKTEKLKDSKGRGIWTVTAKPITSKERDAVVNKAESNQSRLLAAMARMPGASMADLATECGWSTQDGKPYKSLVQRLVTGLKANKLVKKEAGRWVLTKAGIAKAKEKVDEDDLPF